MSEVLDRLKADAEAGAAKCEVEGCDNLAEFVLLSIEPFALCGKCKKRFIETATYRQEEHFQEIGKWLSKTPPAQTIREEDKHRVTPQDHTVGGAEPYSAAWRPVGLPVSYRPQSGACCANCSRGWCEASGVVRSYYHDRDTKVSPTGKCDLFQGRSQPLDGTELDDYVLVAELAGVELFIKDSTPPDKLSRMMEMLKSLPSLGGPDHNPNEEAQTDGIT